jgi:type 1 glutamine amidotransferase
LRGIPEWKSILGGVWVRGESFHPDYAPLTVHLAAEPPAFIAGLDDFAVQDELYSNLSLEPGNIVLATASTSASASASRSASAGASAGEDEVPVVWARTVGPASTRVVYDALGHDTAAYDSAGHRALLARCVRWLLSSVD